MNTHLLYKIDDIEFTSPKDGIWVWSAATEMPSAPSLLVIDDAMFAAFARERNTPDARSLRLVARCATKLGELKKIVFATFAAKENDLKDVGINKQEHVVALVDLYVGAMKAQNAAGVEVAKIVQKCGVPSSDIYVWTKQSRAIIDELDELDVWNVFGDHQIKVDPNDLGWEKAEAQVRVWLKNAIDKSRMVSEAVFWRTTEAHWFKDNRNVPHDAKDRTPTSDLLVSGFLSGLLKQVPPSEWFDQHNYPYLHYSLRSLVGAAAIAHRGIGESLSFGGAVLIFLAGLRDTERRSYIQEWRWEWLHSLGDPPAGAKLMPSLADWPQQDANRKKNHQNRALRLAEFATCLGDNGDHPNPGFQRLTVDADSIRVCLNFDARATRAKKASLDSILTHYQTPRAVPAPTADTGCSGAFSALLETFPTADIARLSLLHNGAGATTTSDWVIKNV